MLTMAPGDLRFQCLAIRGHAVLLYRNKFLFTGDHLAWSPNPNSLIAFRSACWYSWTEQTRSMAKILDYDFEWVLPAS